MVQAMSSPPVTIKSEKHSSLKNISLIVMNFGAGWGVLGGLLESLEIVLVLLGGDVLTEVVGRTAMDVGIGSLLRSLGELKLGVVLSSAVGEGWVG